MLSYHTMTFTEAASKYNLRALTLRGRYQGSVMQDYLRQLERSECRKNATAIVVTDTDKAVGWCLVSHRVTSYAKARSRNPRMILGAKRYLYAMFYVKQNYRRKGIGKSLMQQVVKLASLRKRQLLVSPWSDSAAKFVVRQTPSISLAMRRLLSF